MACVYLGLARVDGDLCGQFGGLVVFHCICVKILATFTSDLDGAGVRL